ncbi:MAG: hypothetical protein ABIW17_10360 [Marmoricola sp.]
MGGRTIEQRALSSEATPSSRTSAAAHELAVATAQPFRFATAFDELGPAL